MASAAASKPVRPPGAPRPGATGARKTRAGRVIDAQLRHCSELRGSEIVVSLLERVMPPSEQERVAVNEFVATSCADITALYSNACTRELLEDHRLHEVCKRLDNTKKAVHHLDPPAIARAEIAAEFEELQRRFGEMEPTKQGQPAEKQVPRGDIILLERTKLELIERCCEAMSHGVSDLFLSTSLSRRQSFLDEFIPATVAKDAARRQSSLAVPHGSGRRRNRTTHVQDRRSHATRDYLIVSERFRKLAEIAARDMAGALPKPLEKPKPPPLLEPTKVKAPDGTPRAAAAPATPQAQAQAHPAPNSLHGKPSFLQVAGPEGEVALELEIPETPTVRNAVPVDPNSITTPHAAASAKLGEVWHLQRVAVRRYAQASSVNTSLLQRKLELEAQIKQLEAQARAYVRRYETDMRHYTPRLEVLESILSTVHNEFTQLRLQEELATASYRHAVREHDDMTQTLPEKLETRNASAQRVQTSVKLAAKLRREIERQGVVAEHISAKLAKTREDIEVRRVEVEEARKERAEAEEERARQTERSNDVQFQLQDSRERIQRATVSMATMDIDVIAWHHKATEREEAVRALQEKVNADMPNGMTKAKAAELEELKKAVKTAVHATQEVEAKVAAAQAKLFDVELSITQAMNEHNEARASS